MNAGQVNGGTNIITNNVINISGFGVRTNIGFINPGERFYLRGAISRPRRSARSTAETRRYIQAGLFDTAVV